MSKEIKKMSKKRARVYDSKFELENTQGKLDEIYDEIDKIESHGGRVPRKLRQKQQELEDLLGY